MFVQFAVIVRLANITAPQAATGAKDSSAEVSERITRIHAGEFSRQELVEL